MFDKIILILIMSAVLLGVAVTAVPIPLLWGTLCLVFLALFVAQRRQQQG